MFQSPVPPRAPVASEAIDLAGVNRRTMARRMTARRAARQCPFSTSRGWRHGYVTGSHRCGGEGRTIPPESGRANNTSITRSQYRGLNRGNMLICGGSRSGSRPRCQPADHVVDGRVFEEWQVRKRRATGDEATRAYS
jgi:hypothetical protein